MKELLMSDDIEKLIRTALREDIGTGDITTASTVSPTAVITGNDTNNAMQPAISGATPSAFAAKPAAAASLLAGRRKA